MEESIRPVTEPRKWRMSAWLVASLVLMLSALVVQDVNPGNVIAVTLYKAHLMVLGGWGGYWLDRALFPYDRPHAAGVSLLAEDAYAAYCHQAGGQTYDGKPLPAWEELGENRQACWAAAAQALGASADGALFDAATIRRALVVLGCLVCVGLGA